MTVQLPLSIAYRVYPRTPAEALAMSNLETRLALAWAEERQYKRRAPADQIISEAMEDARARGRETLRRRYAERRAKYFARIAAILKRHGGMTAREIAPYIKLTSERARDLANDMAAQGLACRRKDGLSVVYEVGGA